jgi:RNA polymerase sigma-70 factor (ECF subfamily)
MANILTLRDGKQFAGWISQIARNLCRDQWRTRKRRRELLSQRVVEEAQDFGRFSDLHDALERLPEEHRLPLMLYYFDGRSTENLARELNLTRGGACTRLFRARNELRKLLEDREVEK